MNCNELAALVAKNNMGEQEAMDGYFQLLAVQNLPEALYKDVEEIISDEMNHSMKLSMWMTRLSGIKPNDT